MNRIIKFYRKTWRNSYIGMNTYLRKKAKLDYERDFLKLMINTVF